MARDKIQAEVEQLKAEVEQNPMLSDAQRDELGALAQQLEVMMSTDNDHPGQDLLDKLEQQVLIYEEDHPVVARVMDNVITLLHSIGI